jgi:cystathionine beta-lyase
MVVAEATYLAWMDSRALTGGTSPADGSFDGAGIAPCDGVTCGEAGRGFMRLNFAMDENVLRHAVTRLAAAFD